MDRAAVLEMADRVAAPHATVAIMGVGSLGTHESEWTSALRELIRTYLGPVRRACPRVTYAAPGGSYEDDLATSPFSDVSEHRCALPNPMGAYCRAGLDTYRSGQMMAVHFQEPTDPIAYDAARDRRRPVPAVGT
ncbi:MULTISPECIES: hypothetical protein [unclassified Streptomyces]|uniref:hypothetical protein n=1 Tax=unclassified Streptomyces TaxID=2593676 RepID=UPI002B1E2D6B|nr:MULTISPECIES: hypothetical protein [unclassified Streptomyces]